MGFEIVRLDHVQLAMPPGGEEEAEAFYAGSARARRASPSPAPLAARGGCWFRRGDTAVHLGVEEDFRPARKAHPAFVGPRPARPRGGARCGRGGGAAQPRPRARTRCLRRRPVREPHRAHRRGLSGRVPREPGRKEGPAGTGGPPPPAHRWRAGVLGRHRRVSPRVCARHLSDRLALHKKE